MSKQGGQTIQTFSTQQKFVCCCVKSLHRFTGALEPPFLVVKLAKDPKLRAVNKIFVPDVGRGRSN